MARRLLVFARDPVPGQVKTRLIPVLGREAATALYRRLLHDTLATAARLADTRCELWVDTARPRPEIIELATRHGMTRHTQQGIDLGARMSAALNEAVAQGCHAVLIGSDCPDYDTAYLEAAFTALGDHDAVVGPASDGGYVLIGVKTPQPELFIDIPWGTDQVMPRTRARLSDLRLRWRELPTLCDLDRPADLAEFPHLVRPDGRSI